MYVALCCADSASSCADCKSGSACASTSECSLRFVSFSSASAARQSVQVGWHARERTPLDEPLRDRGSLGCELTRWRQVAYAWLASPSPFAPAPRAHLLTERREQSGAKAPRAAQKRVIIHALVMQQLEVRLELALESSSSSCLRARRIRGLACSSRATARASERARTSMIAAATAVTVLAWGICAVVAGSASVIESPAFKGAHVVLAPHACP